MNTPTHVILAAAVFAKPNQPKVTWAAILGGFLPDFSLYFMVIWHKFVLGTPEAVIFGQVYYNRFWQSVFAIEHSFPVWGAILLLAWLWRSDWGIAFGGSGVLHQMFDFPLHNDDARPHFWPFSDWKFESPISYWDAAHYGNIVAPLEVGFALVLLAILWKRFHGQWARFVLAVAGVFPMLVLIGVRLYFGAHH